MTTDTHYISSEAALDMVASILERPITAARHDVSRGAGISVEIQRGASVSCHLAVSFDGGRRVPVKPRRSHEIVDHVWVQTARVSVTWSSTDRSVAQAVAALGLYREVVELAALVEAILAAQTIGWSESAQAQASNAPRLGSQQRRGPLRRPVTTY